MLQSYSSIFNLGHKLVKSIFDEEVIIEEKIDGSQFSFGKKDGVLYMRSKGAPLYEPVSNKLFKSAAEYVSSIQAKLHEGWTYRGEVLFRPKHNTLEYSRTPAHNIIIFDIDCGEQDYLMPEEKHKEAEKLGFETVPVLYQGKVTDYQQLKSFFNRASILGNTNIEGMVLKSYQRFGPDKKVLMGKWVSEAFKEVHDKDWKTSNPKAADILIALIGQLKTSARWNKAIQHLQEAGRLENSPRDIGILLKEIQRDTKKEMEESIKQYLFEYYWPKIAGGIIKGFPEHYKDILVKSQFTTLEK